MMCDHLHLTNLSMVNMFPYKPSWNNHTCFTNLHDVTSSASTT